MVVGHNRRPWFYPDQFFEQLAMTQQPELTPAKEQADHDRSMLGTSELIQLDSQGRLTIPAANIEWLGLKGVKDFYLVGCRHRLELWTKTDWERERDTFPDRSLEIEQAMLKSNAARMANRPMLPMMVAPAAPSAAPV